MERKVCDCCKKSVVRVDETKETEGGIKVELKMLGNGRIRDFPFSKVFVINQEAILCDDCAKKLYNATLQCGRECRATKKPSNKNGKGE